MKEIVVMSDWLNFIWAPIMRTAAERQSTYNKNV